MSDPIHPAAREACEEMAAIKCGGYDTPMHHYAKASDRPIPQCSCRCRCEIIQSALSRACAEKDARIQALEIELQHHVYCGTCAESCSDCIKCEAAKLLGTEPERDPAALARRGGE